MSELLSHMQIRVKRSSVGLGLLFFRFFSGAVFGLTIALVFEEIFAFGSFGFWFVLIANLLIFMRVTKSWNLVGLLVLDLVLVLLGMLLRMYILIAPGA